MHRSWRLFGFDIRVSKSWFLLALLITWSLAVGYFPSYGLSVTKETYWLMGTLAAFGLFASILLHELCHSLVARRFGIPVKGITLFLFGGIADISQEPTTPREEFLVAVVGPVFSVALGLVLNRVAQGFTFPSATHSVINYLSYINFALAGFNLIPAFPLDGGRIFRALLWGWKNDLRWATKVATSVGIVFGIIMIIAGAINVFALNVVAGLWWIFLGFFLRAIAQGSYDQLLISTVLESESVSRFVNPQVISLSPDTSLREVVDDIYKYHTQIFPVTDGESLVGCIGIDQVKQFPKEQWPSHRVSEVAGPCSTDRVVEPTLSAAKALNIMSRSQNALLIVARNNKLLGTVSLKDILDFFTLKMRLEGITP